MTFALQMRGVSKHYGTVNAVKNLDLEVRAGEVLGLIGPNGAGKSTTLKIALDLVTDFAGTVTLFGHSYALHGLEIKRRLGYVPEVVDPIGTLRIDEYVRYAGMLHNLRGDEINAAWRDGCERLGFEADPRTRIDTLSKGNRQKLAIISSLLHRPSLWVLDEPMSGLDPTGMKLLEDFVAHQRAAGMAVWISMHTLDIVDRVCDRLCVMVGGTVVAESSEVNRPGAARSIYESAVADARVAPEGRGQ